MPNERTVILGLDGVPYGLIKQLSEEGVMPHTGTLIREGTFRKMTSSIPEISSVAWSSVITGANPGCHGIFGFTDLAPNTYRLVFPNFSNLKVEPFWNGAGKGRFVIVNVPSTYPAKPLRGVMIAGFVALDLERATYPTSLLPVLRDMGYRVDVDAQRAHQSIPLFLRDLDRTLDARASVYRYLWGDEAWDTFMLVFTGTDRLLHFLWDACEDEAHPYHDAFLSYFHKIDRIIGEIVHRLEKNDGLILLSDHGFEKLERDVYVNVLLQREGFLRFPSTESANLNRITESTKAFALDPARIYVHQKGKYPRGSVEPGDREAVLRDLEDVFGDLEIEGKKVVRGLYRGEDLYRGPETHRAPDLVLVGHRGFNLRGSLKAKELSEKGIFAGKHSQEDAFLLVWGDVDSDVVPESPGVSDVVSVIDKINDGNR